MVSIAYAHDGTSVYDPLFLEYLAKDNTVYFLTFNHNPHFVSNRIKIIKIPEPFDAFLGEIGLIEGLRMYVSFLLRSFLLWIFLKRLKPNVLLGCMATKYGFYSALSGFKPFILIVWGSDVLIAPNRFFMSRFMAKFALKKASAVILDSEVQKDAAINLGCARRKILKFPWFDLEQVRVTRSSIEIRRKLKWQENPIVLCSRRHNPICGVQYVIEAIPYVVQTSPEARFLIIGYGKLTQEFKRRVQELGVQGHVKFLGQLSREDVVTYLNAADIYVSSSLSDGTSASLLEAMTLKIPPIVTNIPGNTEWIEDDVNGYLVPVKDFQQLAEKIILLLKNDKLRQRIGERALETVRAKVNWDENSTALGNLISSLVGQK